MNSARKYAGLVYNAFNAREFAIFEAKSNQRLPFTDKWYFIRYILLCSGHGEIIWLQRAQERPYPADVKHFSPKELCMAYHVNFKLRALLVPWDINYRVFFRPILSKKVLYSEMAVQRTIAYRSAMHPWLPHACCWGTKCDINIFEEFLMMFHLVVKLFNECLIYGR